MGYTHYYRISTSHHEWKKIWPRFIVDVKRIIHASGVDVTGPDGMHYTKPGPDDDEDDNNNNNNNNNNARPIPPPTVSTKRGVGINGIGRDSYEPFTIACDTHINMGFCKTAHKPYDDVVTCILLRAFMVALNACQISSDGSWREWEPARSTYKSLWKEDAVCPWDGGDYASSKAKPDDATGGSRLRKLFKWLRGGYECEA